MFDEDWRYFKAVVCIIHVVLFPFTEKLDSMLSLSAGGYLQNNCLGKPSTEIKFSFCLLAHYNLFYN